MTGMAFCGACGTQLNADAKFCASCGARQESFDLTDAGPPRPASAPRVASVNLPVADGVATGSKRLWDQIVGLPFVAPESLPMAGLIALIVTVMLVVIVGNALPAILVVILAGIALGSWHALREDSATAIDISAGSSAKIRSFWVGFTLSLLTLGIYGLFWYYFVNDDLKDVGIAKGDAHLAQSSPTLSVAAIAVGGLIIFPPFLSLYNYGQRIERAQRLGGMPRDQRINPTAAFLLYFPGLFLILPYFVYFWYVTQHQNAALRANAQPAADGSPALAGAVA